MRVHNAHSRVLPARAELVGALIDGLASDDDRLWPWEAWPAMRFDRPLAAFARGGHGPVRYFVSSYEPGSSIVFEFTAPRGFVGTHGFAVEPVSETQARLAHVLKMEAKGWAILSWPLVFRPLHDALIENCLDKAARACGDRLDPSRWSFYVKALRGVFRRLQAAGGGSGAHSLSP